MIHASPLPPIDVPEVPITTHVLQHAARLADKPALIDGPTGRVLTYAGLEQGIRALAGGLAARGFGRGRTLAILAPNLPEYAIVFHGVALAGGTITTINPTYTPDEVRHQLEDAGADLLVTIGMFLDTARAAVEGTGVTEIFTLDGAEGSTPFTSLLGEPFEGHAEVDLDDVVVLPYSSGTTGRSKGVMLTHRNLVANVEQTLRPAEFTEDEMFIAVLPFFHIYGMQVLMNAGLVAGATCITMPRFDLEQFLTLHQKHGVTRSFVAPPIVLALAKHPMVDDYDLSALQQVFSGAAPLSAELAQEAAERIGAEVVQGYGMTELSPVSHLTPPGRFKPGSAGITAPNTEVRIVDVEDGTPGADLGIDEDGEVWVRGPQVMAGYLNNQEATDVTIVADGWLRTGDIGHIDEDGHLFIVDRLKELIKFKGFQVPPAELEAILLTHPAVADSAVIGRPDEEAGELPIGFVVLRPGAEATADEVMAFVAEKVATYKQLHEVTFLAEIPKSASGKILRRELRDTHI
jgi:4-coumarate--CoA ligase